MKKQPKGSMCANCENLSDDCSCLDFENMQQIEEPNIVKCTGFWRKE